MLPHDSIDHLQQVMSEGGQQAFDIVPMILRKVVERKLWAKRPDREGEPFRSFESFVTARLPEGLNSTIDDLLAFCRKHPEVQALIKGQVTPAEIQGRHLTMSGEPSKSRYGNQATYTLKRLKRDHPALFAKVVAGELTAHAAAIDAGFRVRTFSVPDNVAGAWEALVRRFGEEAVQAQAQATRKGTKEQSHPRKTASAASVAR